MQKCMFLVVVIAFLVGCAGSVEIEDNFYSGRPNIQVDKKFTYLGSPDVYNKYIVTNRVGQVGQGKPESYVFIKEYKQTTRDIAVIEEEHIHQRGVYWIPPKGERVDFGDKNFAVLLFQFNTDQRVAPISYYVEFLKEKGYIFPHDTNFICIVAQKKLSDRKMLRLFYATLIRYLPEEVTSSDDIPPYLIKKAQQTFQIQ